MVFGLNIARSSDIHMEKMYPDLYLAPRHKSQFQTEFRFKCGKENSKYFGGKRERGRVREREIKHEHGRSHWKVKEWAPVAAWTTPLGTPGGPRRPCRRPPPSVLCPALAAGWLASLPTTGGKVFPATFPKTSRSSLNVLGMFPLQELDIWAWRSPEGPGPGPAGERAALLGGFYLLWSQLSSLRPSLQMKLNFTKGLSPQNFFIHSCYSVSPGVDSVPSPRGVVMEQVGGGLAPSHCWVVRRASACFSYSARHCSKGLAHVNSYSFPNSPVGLALPSLPFYRRAGGGTEWLRALPKATQLAGGRPNAGTQAAWP